MGGNFTPEGTLINWLAARAAFTGPYKLLQSANLAKCDYTALKR
jgi:hypothetical protein